MRRAHRDQGFLKSSEEGGVAVFNPIPETQSQVRAASPRKRAGPPATHHRYWPLICDAR